MKKSTAITLSATALSAAATFTTAIAALAASPVAGADVCAGAGGRHFSVNGCTDIAGDIAVGTAIAAAHVPYVPGEIPCYTVEGVPYFTPPGDPC